MTDSSNPDLSPRPLVWMESGMVLKPDSICKKRCFCFGSNGVNIQGKSLLSDFALSI